MHWFENAHRQISTFKQFYGFTKVFEVLQSQKKLLKGILYKVAISTFETKSLKNKAFYKGINVIVISAMLSFNWSSMTIVNEKVCWTAWICGNLNRKQSFFCGGQNNLWEASWGTKEAADFAEKSFLLQKRMHFFSCHKPRGVCNKEFAPSLLWLDFLRIKEKHLYHNLSYLPLTFPHENPCSKNHLFFANFLPLLHPNCHPLWPDLSGLNNVKVAFDKDCV